MKNHTTYQIYVFCAIFLLVALGIAGFVFHIKNDFINNNKLIASNLLGHIKLVVSNVRYQKRDLGAYPMSIKAMTDKFEYLFTNGNSSHYLNESQLNSNWNGPYFEKHKIYNPYSMKKRHFQINLDSIFPGLAGGLVSNSMDNNRLKYIIVPNDREAMAVTNEIFKLVIKQCNNEKNIDIIESYRYTISKGNVYKRCGYISNLGRYRGNKLLH